MQIPNWTFNLRMLQMMVVVAYTDDGKLSEQE